jgi:hypothetical protein
MTTPVSIMFLGVSDTRIRTRVRVRATMLRSTVLVYVKHLHKGLLRPQVEV